MRGEGGGREHTPRLSWGEGAVGCPEGRPGGDGRRRALGPGPPRARPPFPRLGRMQGSAAPPQPVPCRPPAGPRRARRAHRSRRRPARPRPPPPPLPPRTPLQRPPQPETVPEPRPARPRPPPAPPGPPRPWDPHPRGLRPGPPPPRAGSWCGPSAHAVAPARRLAAGLRPPRGSRDLLFPALELLHTHSPLQKEKQTNKQPQKAQERPSNQFLDSPHPQIVPPRPVRPSQPLSPPSNHLGFETQLPAHTGNRFPVLGGRGGQEGAMI